MCSAQPWPAPISRVPAPSPSHPFLPIPTPPCKTPETLTKPSGLRPASWANNGPDYKLVHGQGRAKRVCQGGDACRKCNSAALMPRKPVFTFKEKKTKNPVLLHARRPQRSTNVVVLMSKSDASPAYGSPHLFNCCFGDLVIFGYVANTQLEL